MRKREKLSYFEIGNAITFLELNLRNFQAGDECSESRQRLLSTATNAHEKCVSSWQFKNSVDSAD